jgi:hypothetical protein
MQQKRLPMFGRRLKLGAGAGFEPAILQGSEVPKAQWDAQKVAQLLRVVEAWPKIRRELRVAINAIVDAAKGEPTP